MDDSSKRNKQKVSIKSSKPKDSRVLSRICRSAGIRSWKESDFSKESTARNTAIFIAKSDDRIVGFLHTRLITSAKVDKGQESGEFEVLNLAVNKENRREGIASSLWNHFIEETLAVYGKVSCFLEVRAGNTAAVEFYRALGFIQISIRKDYYSGPNEDGLIMKIEL